MKVTGSSLPLLRKCAWWARPEVSGQPTEVTEQMALGTAVHAAIEKMLVHGELADMTDEQRQYFDAWAAWWFADRRASNSWRAEVAFAYRPSTDKGRVLDVTGRNYEVDADEIAGTVDALLINGSKGVVIDWKTGQDFANMTADAQDNWQLKFYAVAASRAFRLSEVQVEIVRITPDGVTTTVHVMDDLELDAVAAEIERLHAAVPASKPAPGAHCRRCRAVAVCPTTTTASDALVQATVESAALVVNAENAGALLVRLRQVQAACEQVETALKRYAAENPEGVQMPGGKRWIRQQVDRESINLNGADMAAGIAALSALDVDDAVETKVSVTKAAIERKLKEKKGLKGKELRETMEALCSDLRASGVMRSVTVDTYKEV